MVDGIHLKPVHTKGVLLILSAVATDHLVLPLARVIADQENEESYLYLFTKCKNIFDNIQISISTISDKHRAIKQQ